MTAVPPPALDRAVLLARLQAMPQAMRDKRQWLLWRLETVAGRAGLQKMPYYVSGGKRGGELGGRRDLAALAPFDVACQRFAERPSYNGVGFAFIDGDGLIGIDLDWKEATDGQPSDHHNMAMDICPSYTEFSPSGRGVHIIVAGQCDSFKNDDVGVEVYCGGRYFTCTGDKFDGGPAEVRPIKPHALAYLQDLVQRSKEAAKAARQAEAGTAAAVAAAADAASGAPRPAPVSRYAAPGQQGNDFRRVNDAAHQALNLWVPLVFAKARAWRNGYRVSSKDLGRDKQEDLQLTPEGIMDFGDETGMSPIDVVIKWLPGMQRPKDALHWLAGQLGIALQRMQPRQIGYQPGAANALAGVEVPAPSPQPEAPVPGPVAALGAAPVDAPGAALGTGATTNVVQLGTLKAGRPPSRGKGDKPAGPAAAGDDDDGKNPPNKISPETWALVDALCDRFALMYSTDSAWDKAELMIVRIAAMRLAFGKVAVNLWLSRPAPRRQMIRPTDLVFEPGSDVLPPQINMFAGLDLDPVPCTSADVAPMLRLLRHLCSESAPGADDVDAVMHWVLCWMAVPLQKIGTKMATACVFHGAQGTGKNLFWDVWRDLFGVYGVTVGQTELEDKFNGWVSRKLAIIGDEVVSRQEMYHNKNRLKLLVTQQDKFPIRGMLQETRWESNHANVVFLSNESQALALEERDRRYTVIYTPLEADQEIYDAVRAFKAAAGAAQWLHYLQTYPLDGFCAHTKPIMTKAKTDLIEASWKSPSRFGYEWIEGYLDLSLRACSAEQLYRAFRRWCDLTGAKWPPDQAGFTSDLKRWVNERVQRLPSGVLDAPRLIYKVVALKAADSEPRKTVRCWLPQGAEPPDGVTEGAWVRDSVTAFERDLLAFCRRPGQLEDAV